jgi:aspartate aminotransferase
VLPSVRAAEEQVLAARLNKEYAGITGIPEFTAAAAQLAYGPDSTALASLVITQSLSGTGALRIGGAFLQRFYPGAAKIYIPTPSWANHAAVFRDCGLEVAKYRYYDQKTIGLDFAGMLADIEGAPRGSVFLLHACAHNPTGVDPTPEQWAEISQAVRSAGHYAFFDMAYQGFASGNTDKDALALRQFVRDGHRPMLAQSFAKNMVRGILANSRSTLTLQGLYGERVGAFSIVCSDAAEQKRVDSQVKILVRPLYSNPPIHGARIAQRILSDAALRAQWLGEVEDMAGRIIKMRALLKRNLERLGSTHDWSHITNQIGMFAYTGLTAADMKRLADEHSVYGTMDGRFSVAGITTANVQRLAEAMFAVKG